jgi:tRNA pseudouridine55 synthase
MTDGFLVVDKPVGLTSHDVVNRVRRLAGGRKVGHTGTLDPFATGVLPIAVGEATKAIQFLDESVKEYQATLRLGVETDSYDATGTVTAEADCSGITAAALLAALEPFRGDVRQVPPMYSAIKQGGKPLYRLARQGIVVERPPRPVTIHRLEIRRLELPEVELFVSCSPGTYIRSLAFDIGRALGCGAHLTALRRLRSGAFALDGAWTLEAIRASVEQGRGLPLLPLEDFLRHLPRIEMDGTAARGVRNGVRPPLALLGEGAKVADGIPLLLTCDGAAVAVACIPEGGDGGETLRLLRVFSDLSPLHSGGAMVQPRN